MSKTSAAISIDDFIALNDEMASLVRADVPLELGLQGFSKGISGRLGNLSDRLAERMKTGESLEEAIHSERDAFPRVYRFAVEAGIKSGNLPETLEALSNYARMLSDARRRIRLALIYPAIILLVTYYLLWMIAVNARALVLAGDLVPGAKPSSWQVLFENISTAVTSLGHLPPIILLVCLGWWIVSSNYFSRNQRLGLAGLQWIPGVRSALRDSQLANFSELSSILLAQQVPLSEALPLAAETVGNSRLTRDVEKLAASDADGKPLLQELKGVTAFPPLMRWMVDVGLRQERLVATFQQLSDLYRRQATHRMERFIALFPVVLTIVVGGSAALFYGLAVFIPFTELMKNLGIQ